MRLKRHPSRAFAIMAGGFFLLLLLGMAPTVQAQARIDNREKLIAKTKVSAPKSLRVMKPFRVIPGLPVLVSEGETQLADGAALFIYPRTAYNCVSFSPDGRHLASGSSDHTVKLWDLASKALIHTFEGHSSLVSSVSFSPDGRHLASGSEDKTVKLWDLTSKALIHTFEGHSNPVSSVSFSPDGRHLASGSEDSTIKLWDLASKTLIHTFEGHSSPVSSVSFSPDGRHLASGSEDKTVKLWDLASKALIHTFEGHSSPVSSVSFSPDGRRLASGSEDKTVKLWDLVSKSMIRTFEGHSSSVLSVSFSPDNRRLASSSRDTTVKLWDLASKALIHTFERHSNTVWSVSFSPDGRRLASGSEDKTVKLWDLESKALIHTFEGHSSDVYSVSFSPDGRRLASGSEDKTVKLWDLASKALIHTFEGHSSPVWSVSFSPDGRRLASGSSDHTVKLWDLASKALIQTFERHSNAVWSVSFSPDGRHLASGSRDTTIKLWDLESEALIHTFGGHSNAVWSVSFSPDGRHLASGSRDTTVKLWDLERTALIHTFEGHSNTVYSVSFSPDGRRLASGSEDTTVKLWDLASKSLLRTFEEHSSPVWSVSFSPDGRRLAVGLRDKTVKLWDLERKAPVHTFEGHSSGVSSMSFSPDGRRLASGSYDNKVLLWDLSIEKEVLRLIGGRAGNWLAMDEQGRIYRGDDGTLLHQRKGPNDDWHPAKPAGVAPKEQLAIIDLPSAVVVPAGETEPVAIRVRNMGTAPVFWIRVKATESTDRTVHVDPPDPDFKGVAGPQPWHARRLAKLMPGEAARLYARITPDLTRSSAFVRSGIRPLDITLVTANGTEVSRSIDVELQTPELVWQDSVLDRENNTLTATLQNRGTAALRNFFLLLHNSLPDGVQSAENADLARLVIPVLQPNGVRKVAFALPEPLKRKRASLVLEGGTLDMPLFTWRLASPRIQSSGLLLAAVLTVLAAAILVSLFYFRRYRHPLLVQLTDTPAQLLQLPMEQLPEAHARLRQTGRLDKVLSEAQVGARTFQQVIDFAGWDSLNKAKFLATRLGTKVSEIQPALWELCLPERFPLNLDRCLVHFGSADDTPKDLSLRVRAMATGTKPVLLIGPDSDFQRSLLETTRDRTNKMVAPTGAEITRLLLHPEPETVLAEILTGQLSLIQLSPYHLGGGILRESIFFGRQEIIAHIMNRDPANYLVVGGRQLGKTSLLKALERRYADRPNVTCQYLGLGSEVLVPRLAGLLGIDPADGLDGVAACLARQDRRYLFLVDEADYFVRRERQTGYQILAALRRMSEEGLCNFILAGFWELYDYAVLDYQSPLKNFAEIFQIGELETEACRQLAVIPMQNMHLAYEDTGLVDRILDATGQRANLVAIVCHQIIIRLKPDQRTITPGNVQQAIYANATFDALGGWKSMTDDQNGNRLDRMVVYATVKRERFALSDLISALNRCGVTPDGHQLERSLARLQLAFILRRDEAGQYFYRVPLFRDMVLRDDPAAQLDLDTRAPGHKR